MPQQTQPLAFVDVELRLARTLALVFSVVPNCGSNFTVDPEQWEQISINMEGSLTVSDVLRIILSLKCVTNATSHHSWVLV